MCLYVKKDINTQVATHNILVFKILRNDKNIHSYFNDFKYEPGHEYNSEINTIYIEDYLHHKFMPTFHLETYNRFVNEAFHSYDLNVNCAWRGPLCIYIGENANHCSYYIGEVGDPIVGLFIIPRGSIYIKCDDHYASDTIRCLGKFFPLEKLVGMKPYISELAKQTNFDINEAINLFLESI